MFRVFQKDDPIRVVHGPYAGREGFYGQRILQNEPGEHYVNVGTREDPWFIVVQTENGIELRDKERKTK